MVNFRQKSRPRNYLARGEQRRLLVLVMTLGLVLILTHEAARPERWFWMWGGHPPEGQHVAPAKPLDNRTAEQTPAGELRSQAMIANAAEEPTSGRYFPGVRPEYLRTIRDDTILRRMETDAFYHLLRILADRSDRELTAASIGRVTYAQLFQQSNEYRGELVTIGGTVRLAVEKMAPPNDYGLARYYELWVVLYDQPDSPIAVNCLELPTSFSRGAGLAEAASVTGFFFKRFAYQAEDGRLHTTPLLLAKTIDWRPTAPVAKTPLSFSSFLWCLVIASVFAFAVVTYIRHRSAGQPPGNLPDRVELDGVV